MFAQLLKFFSNQVVCQIKLDNRLDEHQLKCTYRRMQKCNHTSSCLLNKLPWKSEVWLWQGLVNLFQSWYSSLQNMSLTLCQFSKKNLIWNVLWNVWNFGYYIKSCFLCNTQSFRHSTGRFRWDFFFENWHNVRDIFCKKGPQL